MSVFQEQYTIDAYIYHVVNVLERHVSPGLNFILMVS
jgi:hypothetical protein